MKKNTLNNERGSMVMYKQQYGEGYMVSRPKVKKKKSYDAVFPSGFDDGKGAQRLLKSYIDESLAIKHPKEHVVLPLETITDDFKNASFLDQVNHLEMNNIPLLSQVAKQRALIPRHSTEKKKRLIEIANRLQRDDSTLVRIRLNNESIDDTILAHVVSAIPNNTCLQHLMLHSNVISDEGLRKLCLALRWHPKFHCLWIGANNITDIGAKHVASLLHRNPRIKELNMSNKWPSKLWSRAQYDLHPHITYIGGDFISRQLRRGCGLTSLSLADQRLRDDGAIALFETLAYCGLRSLNLSGNELGDRCCTALGTALKANPLLEILTLAHNGINDAGAVQIASGLAMNRVLHALDLSNNLMGDAGLSALHKCLESNNTIDTLVTLNNRGRDDRAENTAAARKHGVFLFGQPGSDGSLQWRQSQSVHRGAYHSGDQFISGDEAALLATSVTAMAANAAAVFENSSFGKKDTRASGAVRVQQYKPPLRQSQFSPPPRTPDQMLDDLRTPWHDTFDPHLQIGRAPSPAVAVPGVGVLGKSSLSASYRNLFAASGISGGNTDSPNSRPTSHDGAVTDIVPFSSSHMHGSISATGITEAASAVSHGASSKRRKPSFIQTISTLTAAASSNITHEQLLAESDQSVQAISASNQAGLTKKERAHGAARRSSFYGAVPTTRGPAPSFPSASKSAAAVLEPSSELGKTIGVPVFKNMGVMPVRTSISSDADSGQHFLYLRITTAGDSAEDRPTSLLTIARDRDQVIEDLKEARQTPQYKHAKQIAVSNVSKVVVQKAAEPRVTDDFWFDLKKKARLQYFKGIDNAKNCRSTRLEPIPAPATSPKPRGRGHRVSVVIVAPGEAENAAVDGAVVHIGAQQNTRKKTRTLSMSPGTLAAATAATENIASAAPVTRKKTRALSMLPDTLAAITAVVENSSSAAAAASEQPERKRTRALSMNPIAQAAAAAAREAVAATKNRAAYAYHVVNYKTHPELAYQRHLAGKLTTARPGEILAARRKENLIRLEKLREQRQAEEEQLSEAEAASVEPRERKHIHFTAVVAGLMSET